MSVQELEVISFTAQERCDRCGAQAYHLSRRGSLELLWCNHHHKRVSDELLNDGWEIVSDAAGVDKLTMPPG